MVYEAKICEQFVKQRYYQCALNLVLGEKKTKCQPKAKTAKSFKVIYGKFSQSNVS